MKKKPTKAEIWKPVLGWEDFYEVSNLGRIRSLKRPYRTNFGGLINGGNILHPWRHQGYLTVNLSSQIRRQTKRVHRLVLEAFVGPCPKGQESCHNNGIRHDARLENLRWDTCKANHEDKKNHGTHQTGELNGFAKLTDDQVYDIRSSALSHNTMAKKHGVCRGTIESVRYRKTWRHI